MTVRPHEFLPARGVWKALFWVWAICAGGYGLTGSARAADTVETWDAGAVDLELYTGWDGLGAARAERTAHTDLVIGYGIVDRLSAYAGTSLQGDERFGDPRTDLSLGVFGTVLDSRHLDLDLLLSFEAGGKDLAERVLAPALELNLDRSPDRDAFGFYLRAGLPVALSGGEGGGRVSLSLTPGAYLTLAVRHQLLLEADLALQADGPGAGALDIGGVSLGYNVTLFDGLELIDQVVLDLDPGGKPTSVGLMIGLIASL